VQRRATTTRGEEDEPLATKHRRLAMKARVGAKRQARTSGPGPSDLQGLVRGRAIAVARRRGSTADRHILRAGFRRARGTARLFIVAARSYRMFPIFCWRWVQGTPPASPSYGIPSCARKRAEETRERRSGHGRKRSIEPARGRGRGEGGGRREAGGGRARPTRTFVTRHQTRLPPVGDSTDRL
jgi:hypothetical protein